MPIKSLIEEHNKTAPSLAETNEEIPVKEYWERLDKAADEIINRERIVALTTVIQDTYIVGESAPNREGQSGNISGKVRAILRFDKGSPITRFRDTDSLLALVSAFKDDPDFDEQSSVSRRAFLATKLSLAKNRTATKTQYHVYIIPPADSREGKLGLLRKIEISEAMVYDVNHAIRSDLQAEEAYASKFPVMADLNDRFKETFTTAPGEDPPDDEEEEENEEEEEGENEEDGGEDEDAEGDPDVDEGDSEDDESAEGEPEVDGGEGENA